MTEKRDQPRASQGDPVATPPPPHPDAEETGRRIDAFLASSRPLGPGAVPWPLDREQVSAHVGRLLSARLPEASAARRLAYLMRLYLLDERVPDVLARLAASSGAEQVPARAWLCAIAGWIGTPEQASAAAGHLTAMLAEPGAWPAFDDLFAARQALGPAADSAGFEHAVRARIAALDAKSDHDAEVERDDLEEKLENDLSFLREADETRTRARGLSEDERLSLLVDVYLERGDYGGEEFLIPWSVLDLRRVAQRRGAAVPAAAFRREAQALASRRDADTDAAFVSVRALRAADYFGAALSSADRAFVETFGEGQVDPISLEGLVGPRDGSESAPARPRRGR